MKRSAYLPYLKTLRRIPENIVLSMAAREIDPNNGNTCLCGWAVREAVALASGVDAAVACAYKWNARANEPWTPPARSRELFGGTQREWDRLYGEVQSYRPYAKAIEEAFTRRVMECCK